MHIPRLGLPLGSSLTATRQAFYEPNKHRPNFTVLTSAQVHRILTANASDGNVTATGVEFVNGGKKYVVHASKEVIISAG